MKNNEAVIQFNWLIKLLS